MDNSFQIGTVFHDRYVLKRILGRGAFGEVWLAYDKVLDIEVAIKIYIAFDDHGVECFKSEYRYAYELSHPNLVHINYFDVCGTRPYLVMPFCTNGSSNRYVGNASENIMWLFLRDVASGLAYLHRLSPPMVHQDIKPVNILIDRNGTFLISDFGISRQIRSSMSRGGSHQQAGTLAYMSPERFERDPMPVMASDVWSLGATMFELMTGDVPFDDMGGAKQKMGAEIPFIHSQHSVLLKSIVEDCLAKEPWDRPTAQQLADFAQDYLNGKHPEKPWKKETEPNNPIYKTHTVYKTNESSNRRPFWTYLLLAMAIIAVAGFFAWKFASGNVDREQRKAEKLAYEYCVTLAEYRNFVKDFPDGKFFKKASEKIDKLVGDSINSANSKNADESTIVQRTRRNEASENSVNVSKQVGQNNTKQKPDPEQGGNQESIADLIKKDNESEPAAKEKEPTPTSTESGSGGLTSAGDSGNKTVTVKPKPDSPKPSSEEEAYNRCAASNATIEDCLFYFETYYGKEAKHLNFVRNKFAQLYPQKLNNCKTVEAVETFLAEHDAIMRRARFAGGSMDIGMRKKAIEKLKELKNSQSQGTSRPEVGVQNVPKK